MDQDYIYLVMEYCSGGTLKDKFMNKIDFTEFEISEVIKKSFQAINYLHTKNIIHRDLKLENIVYVHDGDKSDI